jgi:hypothetical protein
MTHGLGGRRLTFGHRLIGLFDKVRMRERTIRLRAVRFSSCRIFLIADLMFANSLSSQTALGQHLARDQSACRAGK